MRRSVRAPRAEREVGPLCARLCSSDSVPIAANATVKLEEAVALTAKSASPKILPDSAPNVIVWSAFATVNAAVPLLVMNPASPAKVAATPVG